ncbi:hypothetical protein EVAR_59898_1 [Eumeta japonica]|uniref:Uncharacterized protein n=1 Tax=Eumeta variegata TaxID=151549 RepID=A0A4C2AFD4_EUMVA|nr:hypothetical protein EVAR_59898_1 [Eumeta japonica]
MPHGAFSLECSIRHKWEEIARQSGVLLAAGALIPLPAQNRPRDRPRKTLTTYPAVYSVQLGAVSSLRLSCSLRLIGGKLGSPIQEPYVGSIGECDGTQDAGRPKDGSAKGTRQSRHHSPDSGVDVEEDQTLIDENVTAAVIVAGSCRIGVVSVYFEGDMPIGPYLDRVRYVCSKLGTDKIILGRRQRVERGGQ